LQEQIIPVVIRINDSAKVAETLFVRLEYLESDLAIQEMITSNHLLNLRLKRVDYLRADAHFNLYAAIAFITNDGKIEVIISKT
jgi:hypothetical protein